VAIGRPAIPPICSCPIRFRTGVRPARLLDDADETVHPDAIETFSDLLGRRDGSVVRFAAERGLAQVGNSDSRA
jgi:hypothetical protein